MIVKPGFKLRLRIVIVREGTEDFIFLRWGWAGGVTWFSGETGGNQSSLSEY